MNREFSNNLRVLTDHYKSIADVCRRLEINRSQFNKYLSGRSHPSRHIFTKICDFFGVEEYEILLPPDEFEEIIARKRQAGGGTPTYTAYLEQLVQRSRTDLGEYEGYYFEHSYSMAHPGMILRSLMRLTTDAGVTTYQRLENLSRLDQPGPRMRGRYQGVALYLNDRIFLVDFDSLTGNEISHTVLYPNYHNRLTQLAGLKLGVSARASREPLCARVLLVSLGRQIDVKASLRKCGMFAPGDPAIDMEIQDMIDNAIEDNAFHFRVVPDG